MPTSSSRAADRATDPAGVALASPTLEGLLGYLLAMARVPTSRAFRQHVGEPFALRPVEFTLLLLLHASGRASGKQIGQALRMPAPHVTTLVDRLAERGLAQRGRDPHDGRAVRITLTAAGQALAARLDGIATHMEDGVQATLSVAERRQLRRLLAKLAGAAD